MADEPEGNLSGTAKKHSEVVQSSPVELATATFHPSGTLMDIQNQSGETVRYKLTPQGWKLVKE